MIHSHIFKSWDEIPSISHLLEIENSYVTAFEHKIKNSITYVSYAIEENKVIAFGSATYFKGNNYYLDEFDDCKENFTEDQQKEWRLWVEGLVSTKKGFGTIILNELEKWLMLQDVNQKVINIMSVDESVSFYEENGYVECYTGPRFAGTGNTRVAKAFDNGNIRSAGNFECYNPYPEEIARYILLGRRKALLPYINIPKEIKRKDYEEYVRNNLIHDKKEEILQWLDEFNA